MTDVTKQNSTPPRRRFNIELFSAGIAIVLSVLSIVVAYRSELTQREMLAASIWPHMEFGHGNLGEDGTPRIGFRIHNTGTGPARVRQFQMFEGEREIRSARELLACCLEPAEIRLDELNVRSSRIDQPVLPANDGFFYFVLDSAQTDPALWDTLDSRRFKMWAQICYCSVLDDCWLLDSRTPPATSVDACPGGEPKGFNVNRRSTAAAAQDG